MSRESYLKNLKYRLNEKLPEDEVKEILSDYGDFFDEGAAENRSEEDMEQELGSPEMVAGELLRDKKASHPIRKRDVLRHTGRYGLRIIAAAGFALGLCFSYQSIDPMQPLMLYVTTVLMPVLLALTGLRVRGIAKPLATGAVLVSAVAALFLNIWLLMLSMQFDALLHNAVLIEILIVCTTVALGVAMLADIAASNCRMKVTGARFFIFGALMSVFGVKNALSNVSSPQQFVSGIGNCIHPLVFGLVLSGVWAAVVLIKKRKVRM